MGLFGDIANVATLGGYGAVDGMIHGDPKGALTSLGTLGFGGTDGLVPGIEGALGGGGAAPAPAAPPAPDYSGLELVESNNSKTTAEAQIMTQKMALQQAGLDQELKHAADTELQIATFDTKLQTSLLEYKQGMVSEANHHIERMYAQGHQEYRLLTQTSVGLDLPPPSESDPSKKSA